MSIESVYDAEVDALYIRLKEQISPGEAVRQVSVKGTPGDSEVILDYDVNGILLGIEILGASGGVPLSILGGKEK
ncbi:DUF2283 domain-containing protein [Amycolatopsis sp. NPDC049688]|uniref:DUF2283 domain-containing protein n=1 Tax=Amycolatopsis sp. NPDC049688 TaxID=3154733 RepID=UPI00341D2506